MQAEAGVGHSDEHGVVAGLQPCGSDSHAPKGPPLEPPLEFGAQRPTPGHEQREIRTLARRTPLFDELSLGALECLEQQIEVFVRRPAGWTHDERNATRARARVRAQAAAIIQPTQ